ncbi:hypothetical protein Tco_1389342 [Tanacetum coccineum]
MMSDHNSSDLAPQRQMVSAKNNTSGPVPQCSKRCLIAADQASVFMEKTSVHISSGLVLHQWRLLKITLQAPFLNVQKTFDRSRSSLGLHGSDVCSHQFRPRSSSNDF